MNIIRSAESTEIAEFNPPFHPQKQLLQNQFPPVR